jgi:hypothetical protein
LAAQLLSSTRSLLQNFQLCTPYSEAVGRDSNPLNSFTVNIDRVPKSAHRYSSFWPAGLPYPLFGRGHGFAVKYDLVRVLAQWENKLDCNGLEDVCTGVHIASDHVYEATNRQASGALCDASGQAWQNCTPGFC